MKLIYQSVLLSLSFLIVFIWEQTSLEAYAVQAIGVLTFIFLIVAARNRSKRVYLDSNLSVFILNTIILLLIFSTGIFSSNLFFLVYFILFGIALVFEPRLIFLFVAGIILILLPSALQNDVVANMLKLGSFVLISPLAYFFGSQYKKVDQEQEEVEKVKERAKEAADTIAGDVGGLIKDDKDSLGREDLNRLNEILEETQDLRQETKTNE